MLIIILKISFKRVLSLFRKIDRINSFKNSTKFDEISNTNKPQDMYNWITFQEICVFHKLHHIIRRWRFLYVVWILETDKHCINPCTPTCRKGFWAKDFEAMDTCLNSLAYTFKTIFYFDCFAWSISKVKVNQKIYANFTNSIGQYYFLLITIHSVSFVFDTRFGVLVLEFDLIYLILERRVLWR